MRITKFFKEFFSNSQSSGVLLVLCVTISLMIANSSAATGFQAVLDKMIGPYSVSMWINDGLMAVFFLLVGLEIIQRLKTDSLWNYIQSVYHTFLLRHFLFQRERVQKISNLEHQTVTTIHPIHNGFNRAVRKCIVDIRKDTITIFLKVPRDQQGQKILKEMEAQLKEEIVSQHADYYFSSPIRVRNQLWFTGQKR